MKKLWIPIQNQEKAGFTSPNEFHTGTHCFLFYQPFHGHLKLYTHKDLPGSPTTGSEVDATSCACSETGVKINLYNRKSGSILHSIDKNLISKTISHISKTMPKSSKRMLYVQNICEMLEATRKKLLRAKGKNKNEKNIVILNDLQISIENSSH